MLLFRNIKSLQSWRNSLPSDCKIGFVPTMGALHRGHEALLKKSKNENHFSVLSIFVNPTQFNNASDLENYPQTLGADLSLADTLGIDTVWLPDYESLYPDNYRFKLVESEFSKELCGKNRPGHFDGVLTVVMKLLNVVRPHTAYFGEKDFQQLQLVKDMVTSFFLPIQITAVPTVREDSGLALSSRNQRLSPEQLQIASGIYKALKTSPTAESAKLQIEALGLNVDYVEDKCGRRFAAAKSGEVRLIDNVEI